MQVPGEQNAWNEYLAETGQLIGHHYEDEEPEAWLRLQCKLQQLRPAKKLRQRKKVG